MESRNAQSKSCTEAGQVARAVKRMLAYVVGGSVGRRRTRDVAAGYLGKVEADHVDMLHALDNSEAVLMLPERRAVAHEC